MSTQLEKHAFSLTPSSLSEAMEFSNIIAESDLVPKDYKGKPGNVLVAVQMGLELGLPPLQAIQGIAVINGRPSLWGDALLALVRASPHFESIEEEQGETEAICRVKRRGEPSRTVVFTVEDAKRAGLWQTEAKVKRRGKEGGWYETDNDSPWFRYPRRMLQMRARGFALRDMFADVLKGISMAEEAQDMPDRSRDIEGTATTDDLNARLKAIADTRNSPPENAPPKLEEIIEKIVAAPNRTELERIGALAKGLPEADRDAARKAYTWRMKSLEPGGESQPSSEPT
jgi:hypothetical protein